VPIDSPLELRFDRYLLPKTAVRQSLLVYSGADAAVLLEPVYDVIERVVTYRTAYGSAFQPGLVYQVVLAVPDETADGHGFRAFDGAPLVEGGKIPLHFSFRTSRVGGASEAPAAPSTCHDALSALSDGGCARGGCHTGPNAPMALRLDSGASLRETAISRASREVEGPRAGVPIVDPARFGVGMPIIDPGSPSSSYLVYKLITKPENFGSGDAGCRTTHLVPLPEGTCLPGTAAERARLQDWFVRLDPMPPAGNALAGVGDLRTLSDFIRSGAPTSGCE
jgi:hypothetical protein